MDQNENPTSRWTTDPGAIPGEPYDYLDIPIGEEGEIGKAKAVILRKPLFQASGLRKRMSAISQ